MFDKGRGILIKPIHLCIVFSLAVASCSTNTGYTYIPNTLGNPSPAPKAEVLTPITLTKRQADAVKAGVRESLRDPDSARFGVMVAGKSSDDIVTVCGYVNAKNGYGGYTGDEPFLGLLAKGPKGMFFSPIGMGGSDTEQQSTRIVCGQHGLTLE